MRPVERNSVTKPTLLALAVTVSVFRVTLYPFLGFELFGASINQDKRIITSLSKSQSVFLPFRFSLSKCIFPQKSQTRLRGSLSPRHWVLGQQEVKDDRINKKAKKKKETERKTRQGREIDA